MTLTIAKVVAASVLLVGSAGSLKVTLTAGGHAPKSGAHWSYTARATSGGKPVSGKLTAEIVDPIGGVHPVGFGAKKGNVTNVSFKGSFSDFVVWPASSVGVPLTFRVTVVSGAGKRVVDYRVTPRS